ncbi:uncharacterized protein LOC119635460 [Glossina fuscipes]|uniref:Uncharacterized protein LOC119635460 n=1 Tax=Glossina fuscipes TaxID=7396 RepID=A0A8U0WND0_9MUSC|nr:uncharacterized protein LOC119635460 [Glossina fuscipes]
MDGIDLQRLRSTGIIETTGSSFEHDYIKRMALQYLEYTMTNRLKVIRNVNPPMRDTEIAIEMSRGVYSWSYEKFLARRRFKHVWIDVLMWEFDEALLERVKLHFDLSELNRLVDVLFKAMYALVDGKSIDFGKYLWDPFIDVQTYLTIGEDLCSEAQRNKSKEFEYCNYLMVAWGPVVLPIINETDQRLFEAIEMRYQLNWYRSEVNKMQLKYDILQENYLNSISQALQASKMEEEVGYNIVDVIYNETEVPNEYCQWYITLIGVSFACRVFESLLQTFKSYTTRSWKRSKLV